jgi:hypothetical protein
LGEAEVEVLHPVVVADRKRQILGIHHLPLGNQVEVPDSLEDKLVALVAGRQAVEGVGKLVFQVGCLCSEYTSELTYPSASKSSRSLP